LEITLSEELLNILNENVQDTLLNHGWKHNFRPNSFIHPSFVGHEMQVGFMGHVIHKKPGGHADEYIKHHELSNYLNTLHGKSKKIGNQNNLGIF
jgi:hypothetical protein